MDELKLLRNQIDQIDDQLFALLEQRFTLSESVRNAKSHTNKQIFDPTREKSIINRIPQSPYQNEIQTLYQIVFTLSKAIQEKKD